MPHFLSPTGDLTLAIRGVAELAALPFTSSSGENGAGKKKGEEVGEAQMHVVERNAGHLALKRLIQEDKQRIKDTQEGEESIVISHYTSSTSYELSLSASLISTSVWSFICRSIGTP